MKRFIFYFIISLMFLVVLMEYGTTELLERVFAKHLTQYYVSLVKGTFSMIEDDLQSIEKEDWQRHMTELQSKFGYPIKIKNIHSESVSKYELKVLYSGRIMVKGDSDIFQKRIPGRDSIIVVGPFPEPGLTGIIDIIVISLVVILIIVFTQMWAFSFRKHLAVVNKTAVDFSEGDLNARINISEKSYFTPIAKTFNSMAVSISRLILSHKDMTNSIAHELRTPISRILFGLEMAESATTDNERETAYREIRDDLDELNELISEMLSYGKLERDLSETERKSVNPKNWFLTISEKNYQNNQVEIEFSTDFTDEGKRAFFDEKLIERALLNLISNAVKHAERFVKVTMLDLNNELHLNVEDDGDGISEKDRDLIFEPFKRLDTSRNKTTGGYGLGLAIVKTIIDLHQGTITVGDSELSGASFNIKLPYT